MESKKAKQLAAIILKVGKGRIYVDPAQIVKVNEAMTKDDVRTLIAERIIKKRPQISLFQIKAQLVTNTTSFWANRNIGFTFHFFHPPPSRKKLVMRNIHNECYAWVFRITGLGVFGAGGRIFKITG